MDLERFVAAVVYVALAGACTDSVESPKQDASEPPAGSDASDAAPPPDSSSDSSASPDVSSIDAPQLVQCVSDAGPWTPPPDARCISSDDTDRDGLPDCLDGCPYDHDKIAPGVCGCGRADIDSDGDAIADCMDACPHDPNNMQQGGCGCVGQPGLKPAGTPCVDTACPQTGATCDGAGVCGDRSACIPCPGGRLIKGDDFLREYWFCSSLPQVTGPNCALEDAGGSPMATRMAAQSACAAKGLTLVRIQSLFENRFLAGLLTSPVWIGANSLQTPGQWYWSSATSDSDTLFWNGGPDGSREDSFYYNWGNGAPGAHSCASMDLSGYWSDADCNQMLSYICEYLPHP
jgi:hypothetical protein